MTTVLCVGHAMQDFVFTVPALPQRADNYRSTRFESVGGGPAATAAVSIALLGGRVMLAARVGEDAAADMIIAELQSYDVDCTLVRRCPGCASSVSAAIVDDCGERMIVNHRDAALPDDPDWLPAPWVTGADVVLVDTCWPEGALTALFEARAAGLPGVLGVGHAIPADGALLRVASHVAFTADVLADFTGIDEPARALTEVGRDLPGWCAVSAGAAGVYAYERGELRQYPAFEVPVVETLGAGDVWHGAFALALAEGRGEAAAVQFASAAAALKLQRAGGRSGAPTRLELDEFLASSYAPDPIGEVE
jgi:sulfofructose kinase